MNQIRISTSFFFSSDLLYGPVPSSQELAFGPAFGAGDIIGCGWSEGVIYFTKYVQTLLTRTQPRSNSLLKCSLCEGMENT